MKLIFSILIIASICSAGAYIYFQKGDLLTSENKIGSLDLGEELEITIDVEQECQYGDFDIMKGDLTLNGRSNGKSLLLSIEPIVSKGSKFKPIRKYVSADDIEFGFKTTFKLPEIKDSQHLGIFLCRDRRREKKCSEKGIFDFGQIQRSFEKGGSKKIRRTDKVFFFQHLFVKNSEAQFLTENIETLKDAFKEIDRATQTIKDPALQKEIRKKSKKLYDSLGSYVVFKKPNRKKIGLEILMSKMDQKKCSTFTPKEKKRYKVHKQKRVPKVFKDMGFKKKKK